MSIYSYFDRYLPAKNPEEEEKHKEEYTKMLKEAKKKGKMKFYHINWYTYMYMYMYIIHNLNVKNGIKGFKNYNVMHKSLGGFGDCAISLFVNSVRSVIHEEC